MALKILLADDSMIAQNMGKKILTEAGYEVIGVSNGAAAVKRFPEVRPDIVLLDVYMPGYSGLEVCEKIKNFPATAQVPVLLTVGKLEPFRAEEGMKVKADGVIVKPFEASDLIAVIRKLAERVAAAGSMPLEAPAGANVSAVGLEGWKAQGGEVEGEPRSAPIEVPRQVAAAPAMSPEILDEPAAEFLDAAGGEAQSGPVAGTADNVEAEAMLEIRLEPGPADDLEVELTQEPAAPAVPMPTVPDLEPTILQDQPEIEIATDPALIPERQEAPQQFVSTKRPVEAHVAAPAPDHDRPALITERRPVPPSAGVELHPARAEAPQEIPFERLPGTEPAAQPVAGQRLAVGGSAGAAASPRVAGPAPAAAPVRPPSPPPDDAIGRAIEAGQAGATSEMERLSREAVSRSLDDLDEIFRTVARPPVAEEEEHAPVPAPSPESISAAQPATTPTVMRADERVVSKPAAEILAAPESSPAAEGKPPDEAADAARGQTVSSEEPGELNEAVAEQIVNRVLSRIRPDLVEEVKRLLGKT